MNQQHENPTTFCPVCARRIVKGVQCRHGAAPERAGLHYEADDVCPPGTVLRDGMFVPIEMLLPGEEPYPNAGVRKPPLEEAT